ncbi:interleukin-17 receptor E [Tiliqua scincoides]|uniref:interleukin-17 receptor E n=1 Tax=Tiliqua scincoides TaxID=71010 RepID=UPI0034624DFB
MQFDCFPAKEGQRVDVSLKTIPDGMLNLSKSLIVADKQPGPEFHHTWVPAKRAIEVSVVPEGPAIIVRLCHQLALECEELQQHFHQQERVSSHRPALLPYELLLPCLCIEASYEQPDSQRKKVCPFRDLQEAYGPDLWSSTHFQDYSSSNKAEMVMTLSNRCLLQPNASLCWKESATPEAFCQDIPNSTATAGPDQEYVLEEVDVHPQLCFKFSFGNSSHTECPHQTDTAWNVSVSVRFLQLHLHFHSRIPASFSSVLCQRLSPSHCEPDPPVYTVTHLEGSSAGELDLILPSWVLRSCVLVWRSDVRFSGKQLLCPDVSHKHWGLLALGLGLGLGLLVTVILLVRSVLSKLHGDAASKCCSRPPILLIYSPDSEEHKQLVCAFAALLRSALGCPVLLDLWELNLVRQLGILPWMYAQREHIDREQGQVLLLWSAGSAHAYGLWRGKASAGSRLAPEPHDLFGAAMACLQGELQGAPGAMRQSEWVIAYFSKLCGRRDIPRALRLLPRYRLPQELPGLVRVLQGPSSSAPSWLRARAKTLVCRLLKAERKKGLRSRLYQPWKTSTGRLAGSLVPLAHPHLRKPNYT